MCIETLVIFHSIFLKSSNSLDMRKNFGAISSIGGFLQRYRADIHNPEPTKTRMPIFDEFPNWLIPRFSHRFIPCLAFAKNKPRQRRGNIFPAIPSQGITFMNLIAMRRFEHENHLHAAVSDQILHVKSIHAVHECLLVSPNRGRVTSRNTPRNISQKIIFGHRRPPRVRHRTQSHRPEPESSSGRGAVRAPPSPSAPPYRRQSRTWRLPMPDTDPTEDRKCAFAAPRSDDVANFRLFSCFGQRRARGGHLGRDAAPVRPRRRRPRLPYPSAVHAGDAGDAAGRP